MLVLLSILCTSNRALASNRTDFYRKVSSNHLIIDYNDQKLEDTCLDEYSLRNQYLKKYLVYAPPTLVLSVPLTSYAYFMGLYALITVAPYEILFLTGFGLYYITTPIIVGTALTLEVKYTIEYLKNRSIVKLVDSLRLGRIKDKAVLKFLRKFRKKYSQSALTDAQIFKEILELDTNSSLCNGNLTGSNSNKMRKVR